MVVETHVWRQIVAVLANALEENNAGVRAERERLYQWAEEQLLSAQHALQDTKVRIKDANGARASATVEDQPAVEDEIRALESQQRRQRREMFDVEGEI